MRRAQILSTLALGLAIGCGGRAGSGPAWPRSAGGYVADDARTAAEDGGESLVPHQPEVAVAAEAAGDVDDADDGDVVVVDAASPPSTTVKPVEPGAVKPDDPAPIELNFDEEIIVNGD